MEILQKTIEQIRKQYGLAGGILVAVKDGKVVLKECFGMADAEQNKPVDSKTLFQIASCSKAFTTMVAGQLCDEGKMTWDSPIFGWWTSTPRSTSPRATWAATAPVCAATT